MGEQLYRWEGMPSGITIRTDGPVTLEWLSKMRMLVPVEVDREEIYRHVDTNPTEADAIIDAVLNGGCDRRQR